MSSLSFATSTQEVDWLSKIKEECEEKLSQASEEYNESHLQADNKFEEILSPTKTREMLQAIGRQYEPGEVPNKCKEITAELNEMRQKETSECNKIVAVAREKYNETASQAIKKYLKGARQPKKRLMRREKIEREKQREKQYQMMLFFTLSLQNDRPARPATEADFGLQPRNKKNKECPQARKQKKTPKKWKQTKTVHQPRKKH